MKATASSIVVPLFSEEAATAQSNSRRISYGETEEGEIDSGDPEYITGYNAEQWIFDGEEGDEIELEITAGDLSGLQYWLEDPNGTMMHESGTKGEWLAYASALPRNGPYSFWVGSYPENHYGTYTLSLGKRGDGHLLSTGDCITETLSGGDIDWGGFSTASGTESTAERLDIYRSRGTAGQTVSITVRDVDFTPKLAVAPLYTDGYDPDVSEGTVDSPRDRATLTHEFAQDGDVEILVTAVENTATGQYTLQVTEETDVPTGMKSYGFPADGLYVWGRTDRIVRLSDERDEFFDTVNSFESTCLSKDRAKVVFLSWGAIATEGYEPSNYYKDRLDELLDRSPDNVRFYALLGPKGEREVTDSDRYVDAIHSWQTNSRRTNFHGIHLNLEPGDAWELEEFLREFEKKIEHIDGSLFKSVSVSIAPWWNGDEQFEQFAAVRDNDKLDIVDIQAYSDQSDEVRRKTKDAMKNHDKDGGYSSTAYKNTLELQQDIGNNVTFWEEGSDAVSNVIGTLESDPPVGDRNQHRGIVLHMYRSLSKYEKGTESSGIEAGTLAYHKMCHDLEGRNSDERTTCAGETYSFTTSAEAAYSLLELRDVSEDIRVTWEWYGPSGERYDTFTESEKVDDALDWYQAWAWIPIDGTAIESTTQYHGEWQLDITINGAQAISETFTIRP